MKQLAILFAFVSVFGFTACSDSTGDENIDISTRGGVGTVVGTTIGNHNTNSNGQFIRGQAYVDSNMLVLLLQELTPEQIAKIQAGGQHIGLIYATDDLHQPGTFLPIVENYVTNDQDGFWQVVQITFNAGFTPRQLYSYADIEAASQGANPEITLTLTPAVYWYEVLDLIITHK